VAVVVQLRLVDKYRGGGYTGLNALSNQVLLYVTLLELGLSQSATSLLYEPILHRNSARVSAIVLALRTMCACSPPQAPWSSSRL
jgi:hypothetical protein